MIKKALFLLVIFLPCLVYCQNTLTLDSAIQTAYKNNTDIRTAEFKVQSAEGLKLSGLGFKKPEIFAEYEGARGYFGDSYETRKLGISQSFDFPSLYFLRNDVSNYSIDIANYELVRTRSEVRYNVRIAYLNLQYNLALSDILTKNYMLLDSLLIIAQKKFNVGIGDKLAVLDARINKTKVTADLSAAKLSIETSRKELQKLMIRDNNNFNISEDIFDYYRRFSADNTLYDTSDTGIRNSIDYRLAVLNNNKNRASLSLARASWLPEFNLSYYAIKAPRNEPALINTYGVHFGITIPIWFFLDTKGQVLESQANYNSSLYAGSVTLYQVRADINNYNRTLLTSSQKVKLYETEILPDAGEAMNLAKSGYELGITGYLEYLQAQKLLLDARTEYLNAISDYLKAVYAIYKIQGK